MKYFVSVLTGLFFCIPTVSFASVYISEVAWMGTNDNANAEWIELYNDGEQVDVNGWTLEAVDGQPSITLSGIIQANSYALLERSSDDTVTGEPAFVVYTGALGNTGETLELKNGSGVVVDSVDGGSDWAIGGSNDTKETLQRSGSPQTGSWTTGAPNPQGSEAIPNENDEEEEEDDNTNGAVAGASTERSVGGNILNSRGETKERIMREPALTLDIGEEKTVTKGVPVTFLARAYKESEKEIVVENVEWNFGDGSTGHGREVTHTYYYEGDYVVTAVGHRSGFLRDIQDTNSTVVHVKNSDVVIHDANSKYIKLKNNSNETVDISGYILIVGENSFTIPKNTSMLPQAQLCFSSRVTGVRGLGKVSLFLPNGTIASVYGEVKKSAPVVRQSVIPSKQIRSAESSATEKEEMQTPNPENFTSPELSASAGVPLTNSAPTEESHFWWWVIGLVSAIATAIVAVLLIRSEQQEVIEGFYVEGDEE